MKTLLAALALAAALPVGAADLKVLTAGAYKPVLAELAPAFEKRSGHRVVFENDTAGGLTRRVGGGEAFDLVVLTAGPLAALAKDGHVQAVAPLAKVGIGVAVKRGAPRPDVSTVAAFRQALLAARGIATVDPAAGGTSGIYLWKLFDDWGIAPALRAKAVLVPGGLSAARVASGEAEIAVQQMSELMAVPEAEVIGALPEEIQVWTVYAGALSARAAQPAAARELLDFLAGAEGRAALAAKGMRAP